MQAKTLIHIKHLKILFFLSFFLKTGFLFVTAPHPSLRSCFSHCVLSVLPSLTDSSSHIQSTFSLSSGLFQMPLAALSFISTIKTFPWPYTRWSHCQFVPRPRWWYFVIAACTDIDRSHPSFLRQEWDCKISLTILPREKKMFSRQKPSLGLSI